MKLDGIALSDVFAARPRRLRRHDHAGPFFCMLLDGRYEERAGGRIFSYAPHGVAFHPAGLAHADDLSAGGRLFGIQLGAAYQARLDGLDGRAELRVESGHGDLAWLAARVRREWKRALPCAALAIEGLVLEMLAAAARPDTRARSPRPPWVDRALDRARADFAGRLTVASMAAELGVDPARLARAFRRHHGRSIGTVVRQARVEAACARLRDPRACLTDVAAETGFADQSHLTRVFKRVTGVTPGAYRAELAKGR